MINRIILWITNKLNNIGMGNHPYFRQFAKWSAILAFIIWACDLHKYGSWYMDNATFWHPWGYWVLPLLLLPGIIYVMGKGAHKLVDAGKINIVKASIAGLGFYIICILLALDVLMDTKFPDPGYFGGWIRTDAQFWWTTLGGIVVFGLIMGVAKYSEYEKENPGK